MRISDWSSDVCSSDLQAIMRGGALSIFGDFLFSDTTQYGNSLLGTVAGPVAGLAEDVAALTLGNIHQAARGEDTHVGAELVRFTRSNMPLANLWYTMAATDHLVFHQFQAFFSPGYLQRMRTRARNEFDQEFWWEPGERLPRSEERRVGNKCGRQVRARW